MDLSSQMWRFDNTPNSALARDTVGTGQQSHQDEGATSHVSPTIGPNPGRLSNIDIDNLPPSYIIRPMQILADLQDELYNSVYDKPVSDVEPTRRAYYLDEMYPNILNGIDTLPPDTERTNSQNHVTDEHAHYVHPMVAPPRTSRIDVDAIITSQSRIELPQRLSYDDDNHPTPSSTAVTENRNRKIRCPVLMPSTTECQHFHASGLKITARRGMKRQVFNEEQSSVLITGEIGMKRKRTHVDDHVGQTATSKRARPVGVCYPIQRS
ncbi:hypothetical protein ScPMuIL_014351 [Solemya velum]